MASVTNGKKFLILLCVGVALSIGADAHAVTLEEALSSMRVNHPNIKAAHKQVASARANIDKAAAGFYS